MAVTVSAIRLKYYYILQEKDHKRNTEQTTKQHPHLAHFLLCAGTASAVAFSAHLRSEVI